MPYRPHYLIKQQSRGRPLPRGVPEDHLWPAITTLDLWSLREAWEMGASVHSRNHHGQGVLAALTDSAGRRGDPRRGLVAVQDAIRHGARLGGSETDVRALHQWLSFPGPEWLALAARHAPSLWVREFGGRTALHVLAARVDETTWGRVLSLAPVPASAWDAVDSVGMTPAMLRPCQPAVAPSRRPGP